MKGCPFCEFSGPVLRDFGGVFVIEPLRPVTPGHLLVIPRQHVTDFTADPLAAARVMRVAAMIATPPVNLITSAGALATQSVMHLHVHLIPRRVDDGLALPWTASKEVSDAVEQG